MPYEIIPDETRDVEGTFKCPYCQEDVVTGSTNCPHCGGDFSQQDAQKSTITNISQSAERIQESNSRQISCMSCHTLVSAHKAKKNGWRCEKCGSMVEPGHEDAYIPSTDPDPTTFIQRTPAHESTPIAEEKPQINYLAIGGGLLIAALVIFLIVMLVQVIQKKSERHDATAYVSSFSWYTRYDTLKPYSRNDKSDSPISGEGITPYPKATEQVGVKENLVATKIVKDFHPGPTQSIKGDKGDCPESIATPTKKQDGSYSIPQCYQVTYVPGPTRVSEQVVNIYGTPTPIFKDVYPYTKTGFEGGTPLEFKGAGKTVTCPDTNKLPAGWKLNSDCQKKYWVLLGMDNGKQPKEWEITEAQFNALSEGKSLPVKVDGYGDIAEVTLP